MSFSNEVQETIRSYAWGHLNSEQWHRNFFSFISSPELALRLGDEFLATRFIYKILEGLEADAWLLRAQIRMQVLAYASIYEAVLHHLLFERLPSDPLVLHLTEFPTKKRVSIPSASLSVLASHLEHDGKTIIPCFETIGRTDEAKVRFDSKAQCAFELGFIEEWLRDELIELYEARNAIHIHAEIRKSLDYQLDLSKKAYWRMEPFRDQVSSQMRSRGLIT